MISKNRYFRRSKLSEAKFRQIVRLLALDLTATECAALTGIWLRSVNAIYLRIRLCMAQCCAACSPLAGELEADEPYFGPRRVRGKTIVFGLLNRGQCVYTEIVPDACKRTLQAIIRGKADIASIIHTDRWPGYDGLVDMVFDKHFRVNHGNNEFVRGTHHVNGIESFWSFAKRRLAQFNGVSPHTFALHLKECKFRFNHRHDNLYLALLKLLREHPL